MAYARVMVLRGHIEQIRIEMGRPASGGRGFEPTVCLGELANPPIRLDLSGLQSADSHAIRALQSLSEAGAKLHGASSYINHLLLG